MPKIFGENYWLFQSSFSYGLGFYLLLAGLQFPSPWPILVPITLTIILCCIFITPPFILDIAAVFLLHFLYSKVPLNQLLLWVLILNAVPFFAYHILHLLNPQGRPPKQLMAAHYISMATNYLSTVQGLCGHWEILEDRRVRQVQVAKIACALFFVGLNCQYAHVLNFLLLLSRRLRAQTDARDL